MTSSISTATLIFVIVIGLTGGIGTGKSTVSGYLVELGASHIDADKLGHELLQYSADVREILVREFGSGILSEQGNVDRAKLGKIVFANPDGLMRLNQVMHPRMYQLAKDKIENFRRQGVSLVVLEAALLIEANWVPLVDQIWVTVASEETVIDRLGANKGIQPDDVKARINAQMTAAERIKFSRVVIYTDCSLERLRKRVEVHWQHLLASQVDLPDLPELKEKIVKLLSRRIKKIITDPSRRHSAVLLPLFKSNGQYSVLFTRRTEEVNSHKGQICFPGGSISKVDRSPRDTALREAFEEVGIWSKDVEILGELDDVYTVASDFLITPFVGVIPGDYKFISNPREVKEILKIPLSAFWKETIFWLEGGTIFAADGKAHEFDTYFFKYKDNVVWGATARMLKGFLDLLIPPPDLPIKKGAG